MRRVIPTIALVLVPVLVLASCASTSTPIQIVTSRPVGCLPMGVIKVELDPCGSTSSSTWANLEMMAACDRERSSPRKLVKTARKAGADTLLLLTNTEGEAFRCTVARAGR